MSDHRRLVREHVLGDGITDVFVSRALYARRDRDSVLRALDRARESGQPHGDLYPRAVAAGHQHDAAVNALTQHLLRRIDFLLEHHADEFKPRHV